jgi:hypothetical protein
MYTQSNSVLLWDVRLRWNYRNSDKLGVVMRHLALVMTLALAGCGSIQKMALRSASPMFVKGSDKLTLERNWDFFRDSSPGNLKFLEMIYLQDPENLELLSTLVKGFAGYAYAVPETLAYGDELAGNEASIHKQNAISLYTRALDYGLEYFNQKGVRKSQILGAQDQELNKLLNKKLSKKDLTAVLFTVQAWASLINLQKDNVALVSHVPKVKVMFDWVCEKDPKIENGVCDIFTAQYEAARPRMLGGNPEKARELYAAAIKKRPRHLLIRVGYIQYSLLPAFDQEAYEKEAQLLREEFAKWENLNRDNLENESEYKSVEELNLFNAIAKKRFELMEQNKKKIFEG